MATFDIYNIRDQYKGDTFQGVQFTISNQDGAIDLTGVDIRTKFRRKTETGQVVKTITDGDGITLTDAANGIITFDAFDINWIADIYHYDIEITFTNDVIRTYVKGTLLLIQDTTF